MEKEQDYKLMIILTEIITFFFLHHISKFIDRYPNGWRQLCLYSIGVLFTYPFYLLHLKSGKCGDDSYLIAFLGSGIGTAFGWMSDNIK